MVAQVAGSAQRAQSAEDIDGEHDGNPERAESHLRFIEHIQRDGQGAAKHHRQRASSTGADCNSRVTASRKQGWPPAGQTGRRKGAILK
jgi:hypothetical protein